MTDSEKPFSYRLNASLARIGWEQKDLAEALGCSDSIVSDWACGKRVPPYKTAVQVAGALGVNPYWLLFAADEYCQAMDPWEKDLLRAVRSMNEDDRAKVRRHFDDHFAWPIAEAPANQPATHFTPEQIAKRLLLERPADPHPAPTLPPFTTVVSHPGKPRKKRKVLRSLKVMLDQIADDGIVLSAEDVGAIQRVYELAAARSVDRSNEPAEDSSLSGERNAGSGKASGA